MLNVDSQHYTFTLPSHLFHYICSMKHLLWIVLLAAACSAPENQGINRFSDDALVNIYELQDQRKSDDLFRYLKAKEESHRVAAALAFASIKDTNAIPYLSQMLQIDQDEMPRRAAAYALGQIGHPKALEILKPAFDNDFSKVNQRYILEAIGKCGDSSTIQLFEQLNYTDSILTTGWVCGVFRLGLKGYTSEALDQRMMSVITNRSPEHDEILAAHHLYRVFRRNPDLDPAMVQHLINDGNIQQVNDRLMLLLVSETTESRIMDEAWNIEFGVAKAFEKAALIRQLNLDGRQDQFMRMIVARSKAYVVRNAAYEKLLSSFPENKWEYVLLGLNHHDMAIQSMACYPIHAAGKDEIESLDRALLNQLIERCNALLEQKSIPRETETYIDLTKALARLTGTTYQYTPPYNHPIDWNAVKQIPEDQKVRIVTSQGDIVLQCFVNDAPATVWNFLTLVDSGYYNGRRFHRVVPQFVIQGGCPRGDGWGSPDWSQRSEFSNYLEYSTGSVGIASSGRDTEGAQFFITHCSTPHLDGRYTLFARVIEGMDVVNTIQVGDTIEKIARE